MNRSKKSNYKLGFTLMEVVVGFGIVLFVIAAVLGIQQILRSSYAFSFNTMITVNQANAVTQQIIKAIRKARSSDNGAYMLEGLSNQELIFYTDIDNDSKTERVRFFLEGTVLKQGVIEPTEFPIEYSEENEQIKVLSEYVQNGIKPLFYYYNGDWPTKTENNPLPAESRLSETRIIQLKIQIDADPDQTAGEYNLSPYVQIRNLKDNL